MAAFPVTDLGAILARAVPTKEVRYPVKAWLIVLSVVCAMSLICNIFLAQYIYNRLYGPFPAVGVACLEILVDDLAKKEGMPPATVWRQIERDYRFDNPMDLPREKGINVVAGVVAQIRGSAPASNDHP